MSFFAWFNSHIVRRTLATLLRQTLAILLRRQSRATPLGACACLRVQNSRFTGWSPLLRRGSRGRGGAPLQVKRGRGSFRKSRSLSYQERTGEVEKSLNNHFFFDFLANIRINVYLCTENIKYNYDYGKTYSTNTCFERTGCN